jgi:peroxiredoxin
MKMEKNVTTPSYNEGVKELRKSLKTMLPAEALKVFDNAAETLEEKYLSVLKLKIGDTAPEFSLPNAVGNKVSLSTLLKKNKVVLTFYRGTWCPYCNLQLNQYRQAVSEIEGLGAELIAISPQKPDESLNIEQKNELEFEVLSDKGNLVAKQFTTVFKYDNESIKTMTNLGYDFDAHYADDSREIPVPAAFIIEQDGSISFAKSEGGDYRNRVEVTAIINSLKK